METRYPQEVTTAATSILTILKEEGFFSSGDFECTHFAEKYLKGVLLEKFIRGESLDLGEDDKVLDQHFDKIITGSILYELKKRGIINSYEDEQTEEIFFLTSRGKEIMGEIAKERE